MNICRSNLEAFGFTESRTFEIRKHLDCDLELAYDTNTKQLSIIYYENCEKCGGEYDIPVYLDTMQELKTLVKFLEGYKVKEDRNTTRVFCMTETQYRKKLQKDEL